MNPVVQRILEQQFSAFEAKFGRPPGPEDPVFFDASKPTPTPLTAGLVRAHLASALDAAGMSAARKAAVLRSFDVGAL